MRPYYDLMLAGYRRFSTYRQAMYAGLLTNIVFGLVRMAVLTAAVTAGSGKLGNLDLAAANTYVWLGQGLIGVVVLWGGTSLAERIRNGDVVIDLYRPWNVQAALLAEDIGRAGFTALIRFFPPVVLGLLFFPFKWPHFGIVILFIISSFLALLTSFAARFLIDAWGFWLIDSRGASVVYHTASPLLSGLAVPLSLLPDWALIAVWSTPFPAMMQAPIDVFLGHGSVWWLLAYQTAWAALLLTAGHLVLNRIVRRVVIQGG